MGVIAAFRYQDYVTSQAYQGSMKFEGIRDFPENLVFYPECKREFESSRIDIFRVTKAIFHESTIYVQSTMQKRKYPVNAARSMQMPCLNQRYQKRRLLRSIIIMSSFPHPLISTASSSISSSSASPLHSNTLSW